MSTQSRRLALKQLDDALSQFKILREAPPPPHGWIHAIRKLLGMSAQQLADRIGITQSGIAQIENSEAEGRATLSTLKKVAEGLDCTLVYTFVPNSTLQDFIKRQARDVAARKIQNVSHSMALESQSVQDEKTELQIRLLADEILATLPRHMWNKSDA